MKYSTLLFLSLIIPIFYCCPETTTWLVFENIVESATFPAIDYQNDTFCIIPTDANNMEWIYTRPMLANLNATSNLAEWNYYSFRLENSTTCSFTDSTVQGCLSHCADPNLERLLIQSAMASYKTADIIQQMYIDPPESQISKKYKRAIDDTLSKSNPEGDHIVHD
ncbi:hypothetical protein GCK72_006686 [Caenorhabditis remanei]|uniref:Uncharacterized protein n=1 Tax=Caenorhabditis remanei TaxID=31234 RepID=A0A6A5HFY1_CAERE|nr:hypothetical protein GCK72_006686 [Caenorhabditis remanei]KAF1766728.1 hypothetical protein GCK72_006686 [Caenorhabditis remanei]